MLKLPFKNALERNFLRMVGPILLFATSVLYTLAFFNYYVGWFIDDATYIIGAQSLWQGRYVALYDPATPVLTQFPPGYSLLLAPWVFLITEHWALLKIISFLSIGLSAFLLWRILEGWVSKTQRTLICLLFILSPLTVPQAGTVMSEPFYLFLSLLGFYLLRLGLKPRSAIWVPWVLGGVLGWAAITRTVGILLIPSVAIGFILEKRWRQLAAIAPGALLPPFCLALYNASHAGTLTIHVSLLRNAWRALSSEGFAAWLDHIHRTGYYFFIQGVAGMSFPYTRGTFIFSLLLLGLLLGAAVTGSRYLLRSKGVVRHYWISVGTYTIAYLCLHVLWIALSGRFVFPLLPFLLIMTVVGCSQLIRYAPRPDVWAICLTVLLACTYSRQHLLFAKHLINPSDESNPFPKNTFAWIRQNLPPDSIVLHMRASVLYLYAQRRAIVSVPAADIEEFRYRLLKRNATHALLQPIEIIAVRGLLHENIKDQRWVRGWPDAFPVEYTNIGEHTTLCRVAPDAMFVSAYELYESAEIALAKGEYAQSLELLKQALKKYPNLGNAENAFGSVLLLHSKDTVQAERHYKKAIAIRPYFPIALINLARIYRQRGQVSLALESYEKALQAIRASGESADLEPTIRQESALLRRELEA